MKKIRLFSIIGCTLILLLTGCTNPMPDLTEEQSAMITEYAVSLLLKYDKNYNGKLSQVLEEEMIEDVEEEPEPSEELPKEEPEKQPEKEPEENVEKQPEEIPVVTTIQDFYELTGLEFTFADCILTNAYSGEEDEAAFFFEASADNMLVVLEFDVKNVSAEPVNLDMLSRTPRFRMQAGDITRRVQTTMLINDMTTYVGSIQPGEAVRLALIAEFDDGTVKQGDEILLLLRNDSTNVTISLNN